MMQKNIIIQKQAGQISAAEEYENLKVVSLCWATLPRLKKWDLLTFPLGSWNIDSDYVKVGPFPI